MLNEPDTNATDGESGFALVTVLWIAGLLVVLASTYAVTVRTHIRIAANLTESAAAESYADAGVTLAIIDLKTAKDTPDRSTRLQPSGGKFSCVMPRGGHIAVKAHDEGAVIDLNSAGLPIIQALLVGLGETPARALALAEAIFDYRDSDDLRKQNGAERAEYLAAGLAWTPKNARFDSIDELEQVFGFTPKLIARMQPYVGVHSDLAGIDLEVARPELIVLLRAGVAGIGGTFGGFPDLDAAYAMPMIFNTPSQRRIFAIRVVASSTSGAVFVREAVVDIGAGPSALPRFLDWRRGSTNPGDAVSVGASSLCSAFQQPRQ